MPNDRFLVDNSVLARLTRPAIKRELSLLASRRLVTMCPPVVFEACYSARNPSDYELLADGFQEYPWVPVTDADHRRALEIQAALAARGPHRALSLVDALVAAAAEARDLVVLHYDADFELVAEITGQPHRWIVDRGTAD